MSAAFPLADLPRPHRLTRAQYDRMVETGLFGEDDRVELLYGVITEMSPQGASHAAVIRRLTEVLVLALAGRARIGPQVPFAASDWSEPEPDFAVTPIDETRDDAHPSSAHLIIEVSRSSLGTDLGAKARLYAEAGVPQYWVVDVDGGHVHVHRSPGAEGYADVTVATRGERLVVDAFPDVTVAVDAILPAAPAE